MYSFFQLIEELPELLAAELESTGSGKEQKIVVYNYCLSYKKKHVPKHSLVNKTVV